MSILDEVNRWRRENRLCLVKPLLRGRHDRVVFATKDLYDEILQAAESVEGSTGYRIGLLRNDLDAFSSGQLITVGYGREPRCKMKLLDPRRDEVWELRSRDPSPSLRVFTRFIQQDVLVATNMCWRKDLGGENDRRWAEQIRVCKTIWRQLFPTYNPHTGSGIHDYISRDVIEVGNLA